MQLCSSTIRAGRLVLALAAFSAVTSPAMSDKIGVTAAVNPTATGHPPGGTMRQLSIGSDVVRNERIRTSHEGSTQVIFVDRTTLTISPNSDITINEFVFDPNGRSNLAATMGRGLMRFVGGQISHSGTVQIRTSNATLGIRGGMALIESANGKTTVIHLHGVSTVTTASSSVTITRPGYFTEAGGGQISTPKPAPAALIATYNARLQSKQGQTAGVRRGHVTADKLKDALSNNSANNPNSPGGQFYQPTVNTQPQQTGSTGPTSVASGGGGPGGGGIGGGGGGGGIGGGGGVGGGGGGVGGGGGSVGGLSGPPWGLLIAPGQTGNFPGPPPGLGLKGIKGHQH